TPLDTAMAEAAGRRVAETVEKMTTATLTGPAYGADSRYGRESKVYGYLNFPPRLTKFDLTVPNGTNPQATVDDVLAMRELLYDNNYFGPYMIYHSTDWDKYLDNDYYVKDTGLGQVSGSTQPLRDRLRAIEGIQDVRRLDFLKASEHPFTMIMVQMTSEVAQAVTGMGLTTVQWQTMGGMRLNFKVMSIMVPRLRADFYDRTGILHAKAA